MTEQTITQITSLLKATFLFYVLSLPFVAEAAAPVLPKLTLAKYTNKESKTWLRAKVPAPGLYRLGTSLDLFGAGLLVSDTSPGEIIPTDPPGEIVLFDFPTTKPSLFLYISDFMPQPYWQVIPTNQSVDGIKATLTAIPTVDPLREDVRWYFRPTNSRQTESFKLTATGLTVKVTKAGIYYATTKRKGIAGHLFDIWSPSVTVEFVGPPALPPESIVGYTLACVVTDGFIPRNGPVFSLEFRGSNGGGEVWVTYPTTSGIFPAVYTYGLLDKTAASLSVQFNFFGIPTDHFAGTLTFTSAKAGTFYCTTDSGFGYYPPGHMSGTFTVSP